MLPINYKFAHSISSPLPQQECYNAQSLEFSNVEVIDAQDAFHLCLSRIGLIIACRQSEHVKNSRQRIMQIQLEQLWMLCLALFRQKECDLERTTVLLNAELRELMEKDGK